eukprot:TRINITY_DN19056_c0_g1_i1.p1 TRINITY_DN19056_c0_g1~~TRINITY_DN19056_c0_g1_i1.p1  ORF type:complete len:244 (-),score=16.54 TRINITY_DN19056_c0_g1_i1:274-1005(-)
MAVAAAKGQVWPLVSTFNPGQQLAQWKKRVNEEDRSVWARHYNSGGSWSSRRQCPQSRETPMAAVSVLPGPMAVAAAAGSHAHETNDEEAHVQPSVVSPTVPRWEGRPYPPDSQLRRRQYWRSQNQKQVHRQRVAAGSAAAHSCRPACYRQRDERASAAADACADRVLLDAATRSFEHRDGNVLARPRSSNASGTSAGISSSRDLFELKPRFVNTPEWQLLSSRGSPAKTKSVGTNRSSLSAR